MKPDIDRRDFVKTRISRLASAMRRPEWILFTVCFCLANSASGGITFKRTAQSGDQAPYLPDGILIERIALPIIDDGGQITWYSTLRDTGANQQFQSIWTAHAKQIPRLVASNFTRFETITSDPILFRGNKVVFSAQAMDGSGGYHEATSSTGIKRLEDGLRPDAAGLPDGSFLSFSSRPLMNDNGTIAFRGVARPPGAQDSIVIWKGTSSGFKPDVSSNDPAPGLPPDEIDTTFAGRTANFQLLGFGFDRFFDGPYGLLYSGNLAGPGIEPTNCCGLWFGKQLIARFGDPAPGLPAGSVFGDGLSPNNDLFHARLSGTNGVIFRTKAHGPGLPEAVSGIWSSTTAGMKHVAHEGQDAPGAPGARFLFLSNPISAGAGLAAFQAFLEGAVTPSNNTGIWKESGGALRLMAREGDPAIGLPGSIVDPSYGQLPTSIVTGPDGRLAFNAIVNFQGGGFNAVAATPSPGEQPKVIAYPGMNLEGREVVSAEIYDGNNETDSRNIANGNGSSLTANGRLALRIESRVPSFGDSKSYVYVIDFEDESAAPLENSISQLILPTAGTGRGGDITIQFLSQENVFYTVLRAGLNGIEPVRSRIVGTGDLIFVVDPGAGASRSGFYLLRRLNNFGGGTAGFPGTTVLTFDMGTEGFSFNYGDRVEDAVDEEFNHRFG
jgi:hypothetical protein